jgi:hypothetical protein
MRPIALPKSLLGVLLAGMLVSIALGGPVATADASVTSQIISPSGPTYALYDETLPSAEAFAVSGDTTISGAIALRCYYGVGPKEFTPLVAEVTPSAGTFSATVPAAALADGPCVLRAVPVANEEAHPPGTSAEEASDPFQGPRVAGSRFELFGQNGVDYGYEYTPSSLTGDFQIDAAGECGLDYSRLFASSSLDPSDHLFDCDAALYDADDPSAGDATRSDLQIDSANAYGPSTAEAVNREIEEEEKTSKLPVVAVAGVPHIAVTKTFDPSDGLATIHETDPIVRCSPSSTFPPTPSSCREFVPTGVTLGREWQTSSTERVAAVTDSWSSTDGAAHALNALYDQSTVDGGESGGAYEFPGESAFQPTHRGETVTLPAGSGGIYYKQDAATPEAGDGVHPFGAILYDTPPSEPLAVYDGSEEESYNGFEMPYRGTIPAGGAYVLRMAFVQAYALAEVQSLAAGVLAGYPASAPPTPPVPSPIGAETVTAPLPLPAPAHVSAIGPVGTTAGAVHFTLTCAGRSGSSCQIEARLTTVERIRRGRLVALAAGHRPRTRVSRVTVGIARVSIRAGQHRKITIRLNATGRALLARFGRLPVHLAAVALTAGRRTTVLSKNLLVRPAHRARRRRRHRHG